MTSQSPENDLRVRLTELERESRLLEPSPNERKHARQKIVDHSEEFLNDIENLKAYEVGGEKGVHLFDSPITDVGIDIDEAVSLIKENVDKPGLNPASGGHLAYIPGGGIYYSALADYLADVFNKYAGVFYASPGAVRMENMLTRWMNDLVSYPSTASGNLTTSGSLANMIAVVVARDAKGIKSADIPRSVIYLSKQAHHSVDKGIRVAGLGECILRFIPIDEKFRIDASALEKQVSDDKAAGLDPFLVVASAGTTDVGAIDPLADIGDIAKRHGLWYHIDAAYGGFFILTDEGREKLNGIGTSGCMIIYPHKRLFFTYRLGALV